MRLDIVWTHTIQRFKEGLNILKKIAVCFLLVFAGLLLYQYFFSKPKVKHTDTTGENIICFGDSLTFGTGASPGKDYPSQLSSMISRPVLNKGVPGDTTARAMARLDQDVLSLSPRIVLITLGGNDLKNGVPKDTAFRNLRRIVESIQAKGALVIIGGIDLPMGGRGFGEGYKRLCDETGAILIPNIFDGIMGNPQFMSDSIHPNDAGYTRFAQEFLKAF
jgi:lysophospholipase L1-like esterase